MHRWPAFEGQRRFFFWFSVQWNFTSSSSQFLSPQCIFFSSSRWRQRATLPRYTHVIVSEAIAIIISIASSNGYQFSFEACAGRGRKRGGKVYNLVLMSIWIIIAAIVCLKDVVRLLSELDAKNMLLLMIIIESTVEFCQPIFVPLNMIFFLKLKVSCKTSWLRRFFYAPKVRRRLIVAQKHSSLFNFPVVYDLHEASNSKTSLLRR